MSRRPLENRIEAPVMQSLHAFRSALLLQRCQQLQATANRMDSARDNRVRLRVIPGPKRGSARAGQVSLPFSVAGCLVVIELKIDRYAHRPVIFQDRKSAV